MANEFYPDQPDYIAKLNELWAMALSGGGGGTTNVTGSAPIVVSGSTTKNVAINAATGSLPGSMSAADFTKLAGIANGANNYSLPISTASALGGIKIGSGLTIDPVTGIVTASGSGAAVPFNTAVANGAGPTLSATEATIGTVTLTNVTAGSPVLIIARVNLVKDTGATSRTATMRVRRGSLNTDTQVGRDAIEQSQAVASTHFGPGVIVLHDAAHGGGSSITWTVRGLVDVASGATTPNYEIQAIELKGIKGDVGATGSSAIDDASTTGANTWSATKIAAEIAAAASSGSVTLTGTQTLTNKTVTNPANTQQTLNVAGSAIPWDMNLGAWGQATLTANRTMAAPTNLKPGVYILYVTQGGAGGFTITSWDPVFKFHNLATPVFSTAPGITDTIIFISNGVSLFGDMWCKGAAATIPPGSPTYSWGTNLSGMEWAQPGLRSSQSSQPNINYMVPRPQDIQFLAACGMTKSRLPIQWELLQPIRLSSPANATVRAGYAVTNNGDFFSVYQSYITDTLDAHAAAGMTCILDLHNYCRYRDFIYNGDGSVTGFVNPSDPDLQPYTTDATKVRDCIMAKAAGATITTADFNDFWNRIANLWKNHPGFGGYGLMNEPNTMPGFNQTVPGGTEDFTIWPFFAQSAINAIRAVDPTGKIYVSGNVWSSAINWSSNNPGYPLSGNNLIYEGHMYLDANSAGNAFDYDVEVSKGYSAGESGTINANTGVNRLAGFISWGAANNAKLALTEFGMPLQIKTGVLDQRWVTMYRNALTSAVAANMEVYSWMGGNHWPIHSFPINHVPQFHQSKTMEPEVSGEFKAKLGINTYTLFDDGPGYGLSGTVLTITVYARGNLPSSVTLNLISDNGGTFSSPTIVIPAGPNGKVTYTYTTAADRVATISYTGAAQVPPPRKVFSIVDPVAAATTSLANGALALIAKYQAAKWVAADGYLDYIGTSTGPATTGNPVRAICDSGWMSTPDNPMEMLWFLNEGLLNPNLHPATLGVDSNSKKYMDTTTTGQRGLWCKKLNPVPTFYPNPAGTIPFRLNQPHFAIAAFALPVSNVQGSIFVCGKAETRAQSELFLEGGIPKYRIRDDRPATDALPSQVNQESIIVSSGGAIGVNVPTVVAFRCANGAQDLRVESVARGSATLVPDDAVYNYAGWPFTYDSKPYFNQMLMCGNWASYFPGDSFPGRFYAAVCGPGNPTDVEMNVIEAYLSSLAGGSLGLAGGGSGMPAGAWAGGKNGFWADPDDLTTLFQANQTSPVTTAGQFVGKINDKSGNGNHAVDATSPGTYASVASHDCYLSSNGYEVPGGGGSTSGFLFVACIQPNSGNSTKRVLYSDKTSANVGIEVFLNASNQVEVLVGNSFANFQIIGVQTLSIGTTYVVTVWYDGSFYQVQINNNGAASGGVSSPVAGSSNFTLGATFGGDTNPSNSYWFSAVLVKDSTVSDANRALIKTAVGAKGGVTV